MRNAGPEILGNDHLYSAYQRVWQVLPEFCKSPETAPGHPSIVLTSPPDQQVLHQVTPTETDELFKEYIVNKETVFLAKVLPT